jgi:hypothetical protein
MDDHASVALIQALAAVWRAIRAHHPDVPPVVILPAPAPHGRGNVLGHFAALRWTPRKRIETQLHEVVVVAEHLNRDAADIVETVLHEAAHAVNFARGIADCSASQYHNGRFKEAAEELGLSVTRVPHYGYALTALTDETRARYAGETAALETVLLHRRALRPARPPTGGTSGPKDDTEDTAPRSRSRKAVCACGYIIRVSKKTIEDTVIRCESCGEPFQLT